jgi:hypothetical protein
VARHETVKQWLHSVCCACEVAASCAQHRAPRILECPLVLLSTADAVASCKEGRIYQK